MFASLWGAETRKHGYKIIFIGMISALVNSILILGLNVAIGWSFVIAMISATIIGSFILRGEHV